MAAFFIVALFPGYSPFELSEGGTVLVLTPLIVGMLLGLLMSERDLRSVAAGTFIVTISSSVLIAVFIASPIIAGVASAAPAVSLWPRSMLDRESPPPGPRTRTARCWHWP